MVDRRRPRAYGRARLGVGVAFINSGGRCCPSRSSDSRSVRRGRARAASHPRPAVLYIVSRSLAQGGLPVSSRISASTRRRWSMSLAASLGLSAILMSSALAFAAVKYLGAAYLIWLGLRKLFGTNRPRRDSPRRGSAIAGCFARLHRQSAQSQDGAVLSRLPAAVRRGEPGPCGDADRLSWPAFHRPWFRDRRMLCHGRRNGRNWIRRNRGYLRFERYVSGTVLVGLGLTAAFAGPGKNSPGRELDVNVLPPADRRDLARSPRLARPGRALFRDRDAAHGRGEDREAVLAGFRARRTRFLPPTGSRRSIPIRGRVHRPTLFRIPAVSAGAGGALRGSVPGVPSMRRRAGRTPCRFAAPPKWISAWRASRHGLRSSGSMSMAAASSCRFAMQPRPPRAMAPVAISSTR